MFNSNDKVYYISTDCIRDRFVTYIYMYNVILSIELHLLLPPYVLEVIHEWRMQEILSSSTTFYIRKTI